MTTQFSQLIYTSTPESGFRLLTSGQVPPAVEQTFVEKIVHQHWNAYDPPEAGYRAVYLHQVDMHTLFGWLYDDGSDELGRGHVPYFVCYHLVGPLNAVQLESIFMCLHKGPVAVPARHHLPTELDLVSAPDLWSYQPARPGVRVGVLHRQQGHTALEQGEPIDLVIPQEQPAPVLTGVRSTAPRHPAPLRLPEFRTLSRATVLDAPAPRVRPRPSTPAIVLALLLPFGLGIFLSFNHQTEQKPEVADQKVTSTEAKIEAVERSDTRKLEKTVQHLGRTESRLGTVAHRLTRTERRLQEVDTDTRKLSRSERRTSDTEGRDAVPPAQSRTVDSAARPSRRSAKATPRHRRILTAHRQSVSRLQRSPELARALAPSSELDLYTTLKEQQAKADATRMYGLYRKNRKS